MSFVYQAREWKNEVCSSWNDSTTKTARRLVGQGS